MTDHFPQTNESSEDTVPLLSDEEIIILCSDRGKAKISVLKKALKRKIFDPTKLLQDEDNEEVLQPILFYTLGWGMIKHSKLLIDHGVDPYVFSKVERDGFYVDEACVLQHFLETNNNLAPSKKIELLKEFKSIGIEPKNFLPKYNFLTDLSCRFGEDALTESNQGILNQLLESDEVIIFDTPNSKNIHPVLEAVVDDNFEMALILAKLGFSLETKNKKKSLLEEICKPCVSFNSEKASEHFESLIFWCMEKGMDLGKRDKHGKSCMDNLNYQAGQFKDDKFSEIVARIESTFLHKKFKTDQPLISNQSPRI